MNIEVLINMDEALDYARNRLGDLQKKANMAVRTAINKSAKEIKKHDEKITKKTYTDKNDINDLQFKKATTGNLQAILKDKGRNISLTHFSHYPGWLFYAAVKKSEKDVWKYGNPAFTVKSPKLKTIGPFVRKSKNRFPIEKLSSISSPVQHGNPSIWAQVEPNSKEILYKYLDKEIERILSK